MEQRGSRTAVLPRGKKPSLVSALRVPSPLPTAAQCPTQGMQGAPRGPLSQELFHDPLTQITVCLQLSQQCRIPETVLQMPVWIGSRD